MCYIDDRNASAAAHTSHQEIPAVGGEDRTAQGVATAVVAVDRDRRAEIQFQLIVHHDAGPVAPLFGKGRRNVDQAHRIVAPVGNSHERVVRRCGYHFRKWSGLHHAYDAVALGVDNGDGRRLLGVNIKGTAVIRHPQIATIMRESALDRLSVKAHRVVVMMAKGEEARRRSPQRRVVLGKGVADDFQFLVRTGIEDDSRTSLQGIDVVFPPIGVNVDRFGREDVRVARCSRSIGVVLLLGDQTDGHMSVGGNSFGADGGMYYGRNTARPRRGRILLGRQGTPKGT